jgi:FixJ family two-component response regulator
VHRAQEVAEAASDTTDPSSGLRAVAALRRLVETLELRQVEAALAAGASWQQVAVELGVTRQAVHKKYARRLQAARPAPRKD